MPDLTGSPAGDGNPGGDPAPQGEGSGSQPTPKPEDRTFTQADLDRIVADRVARAKPADYDEAKAALDEKKRREEGEKTDLQKATEANQTLTQERDAARNEANAVRRDAAIQLEAFRQGADAELVALALASDDTIVVKEGKVEGVEKAVKALLERKPNLKLGGTPASGGEFGGRDGGTVVEQIRTLRQKGDKASLAEARRLEIAQQMAAPQT